MESLTRNDGVHGVGAVLLNNTRALALANKVCWWKPPDAVLRDPVFFLNQAMMYANFEEGLWLEKSIGRDALREALDAASPGIHDERSWRYWRVRLDLDPDTPLPERRIPK